MTAIKHMSYEEAKLEHERLSQEAHDLWTEIRALDNAADHYDHIAILWQGRIAKNVARVRASHEAGALVRDDVRRMLDLNAVYFERYSMRINQRNRLWAEKHEIFRQIDSNRRRHARVTKRGWETFGPLDPHGITNLWRSPRRVAA